MIKYDIADYLKDDKELQKAVISELLNENIKLNAIIDSYQPRLQKYKDILQEIKVYAERIANEEMIPGYAIRAKSALWRIANIINKAEEE